MAHWNPHLLSTKLCRVLDAELTTVDEIARLAELTPRLIEAIAKGPGVKLTRDTELRISKAIGPLFHAHPELYRDPERVPKRGVIEEHCRDRAKRGFGVYDSKGNCLWYSEWPKADVTPALIRMLERYLEYKEPQPKLQII
jgi:hypothetical protein